MTQTIEGYLFPPRSSDRVPVRVSVGDDAVATVIGEDGSVLLTAAWAELKISARIGNTARRLTFPDGDVVETNDNDIVDAIGVIGGTNVQFAHDPVTDRVVVIEINPRTSRSSALASKATGFPIALISSMLAGGMLPGATRSRSRV